MAAGELDRLADAARHALARVLSETRVAPGVAVLDGRRASVPEGTEIALVLGDRDERFETKLTDRSGLTKRFSGTFGLSTQGKRRSFAIFDRWDPHTVGAPPASFDVVAVIPAFNEEDIIEPVVRSLRSQGLRVHVIDNASTDSTPEILARLATHDDQIAFERFPKEGPAPFYELGLILGEVERVAAASGADWALLNDADEWMSTPWPGVGLRHGLYAAEKWGFTSVNFARCEFVPTDDSWSEGANPEHIFERFRFSDKRGAFSLQRAWKPSAGEIRVAAHHGHDINFEGRRTFPYRFVQDHYPVRSQAHGMRKVFGERLERFSPEERAKGLHIHYDHYDKETNFIVSKEGLYSRTRREDEWKLQLLTCAGLEGNPQVNESLTWVLEG